MEIKKKKQYKGISIKKVKIDKEISFVMSSTTPDPPGDPWDNKLFPWLNV